MQAGATLDIPAGNTLTANSNVTVHGDLSGADAYFTFYGATLTNTGSSISVDNVSFYATGTQFITGAGSWTGTGTLTIDSGSSTYLANDVTMAFSQYLVNGTFSLDDHVLTFNPAGALTFTNWYGGTFAMGSQTLAFDAPGSATFNNYGTTSGGGTFETSGTVSLVAGGNFDPPLEVVSGTTTAYGTIQSTITVQAGATLKVPDDNNLTANSDVTVHGDLSGAECGLHLLRRDLDQHRVVDQRGQCVLLRHRDANHHRRRVVDGHRHVLRRLRLQHLAGQRRDHGLQQLPGIRDLLAG